MKNEKFSKEKTDLIVNSIKDIHDGLNEPIPAISVYSGMKYPKNMPDFIMLFQMAVRLIIKSLTPSACKIFLYLLVTAMYDNVVGVTIKKLISELEFNKRTVIKALKELKDKNIVVSIKDLNDNRISIYIINPHTAWKGTIRTRNKFIKKQDEKHLQLQFPFTNEINNGEADL